jgi:tetratricopeptide (TPR) repeat protein
MTQKYALLIANAEYNDASISPLTKPQRNIEGLAKVLRDPSIGGFPADNIKTLINHPFASIRRAIANFYTDKERDALLLLYYTGHGVLEGRNQELHLAVQDTETNIPDATAISASFISRQLSDSRAKQKVIVLDCCHSGAFKVPSDLKAPGASVVILTASDHTEFAWESEDANPNGPHTVFTHYLIEALETGEADSDQSQTVTVDELYEYLQVKMRDSQQKPQRLIPFGRHEGIVIAKAPPPAPPHVPEELLEGHYFISHAGDAPDFVEDLYAALIQADVPVWLDVRDLQSPGPDRDTQVLEALQTCQGVLFAMTDLSVADYAPNTRDWRRALRYKKPIIPLRIDPEVEPPFALDGRDPISFTDTSNLKHNVERLKEHLAWLNTPAGQLQQLQQRLGDAYRDLKRSAEEQERRRIQAEIEDLKEQIDSLDYLARKPERVQRDMKRKIRREIYAASHPRPESTQSQARPTVVNSLQAPVPPYFQGRAQEIKRIDIFLQDPYQCVMIVRGRAGIGKTVLVTHVLKSLLAAQAKAEAPAPINNVVFLSAVGERRLGFSTLYTDLLKFLPTATAQRLENLLQSKASTATKVKELLTAFTALHAEASIAATILFLDNLETLLDTQSAELVDSDLGTLLRMILTTEGHGLKAIITTRVTPQTLATVPTGRRAILQIEGLATEDAVAVLRQLDQNGLTGLQAADETTLTRLARRTKGYPRALEALHTILAMDRTRAPASILADTEHLLPANVLEELVGEAFNHLDAVAQQILQILAVYGRPVPTLAVDLVLQNYHPGLRGKEILRRLVNGQFVHYAEEHYSLHPVDQAYALARLKPGAVSATAPEFTRIALYHYGAAYFREIRIPEDQWHTIEDIAPQLSEFELSRAAQAYTPAAQVLYTISPSLLKWGHARLVVTLAESLRGHLSGLQKAQNLEALGLGYQALSQTTQALACFEEAITLFPHNQAKDGLLFHLGDGYYALGQVTRAMHAYQQALAATRRLLTQTERMLNFLHNPRAMASSKHRAMQSQLAAQQRQLRGGEAKNLSEIGTCHLALGDIQQAQHHYIQALAIAREIGDRYREGVYLGNLGRVYLHLGQAERARAHFEQALTIAREIGNRGGEGTWLGNLGRIYLHLGQTDRAQAHFEQALTIARETGDRQGEGTWLGNLGRIYQHLGQTERARAHFEQALTIAREIGDRQGEGTRLGNLGRVYLHLGQTARAQEHFEQALTITREISDQVNISGALNFLARLSIDTAAYDAALAYAQESVEVAVEISHPLLCSRGYTALAQAHYYHGDLGAARAAAEAAASYDVPTEQHNALVWLDVLARLQGDPAAAQTAFTSAIEAADSLLASSPQWYDALYAKGLALCGRALCVPPEEQEPWLIQAHEAYQAALAISAEPGVRRRALRWLDVLATADDVGSLAPIREIIANDGNPEMNVDE